MTHDQKSLDASLAPLVQVVRLSSALGAHDVNFYSTLDHAIQESATSSTSKLLLMANTLASLITESGQNLKFTERNLTSQIAWSEVSEVIDLLFEKIDTSFDKLSPLSVKPSRETDDFTFLVKEKPQDGFIDPLDNTGLRPFSPKIKEKPFALKPLSEATNSDDGSNKQPYEYEIMNQPYPDVVCEIRNPIASSSIDDGSALWVDSVDKVHQMIEELKKLQEIAVDLEHHDLRSYYGITCLMQISNRLKDWLVDTLALRGHLCALNEVFANPNIVKVFHGAFMDIIWLQRDLGLYVVSLFDTYHAAKALGYPKLSLGYLLERHAGFQASKKYQLADWRIRPLTASMTRYARADTHFLLGIYDELRNELISKDRLRDVLYALRKVAAQKFEYNNIDANDELKMLDTAVSVSQQYNVPEKYIGLITQVMKWRDKVSRILDESHRYILPTLKLIKISTGVNILASSQLEAFFGDSRDAVKPYLEELATTLTKHHSSNINNTEDANHGKFSGPVEEVGSFETLEKVNNEQAPLLFAHADTLLDRSSLLDGLEDQSSEILLKKHAPRELALSSLQELIFSQPGFVQPSPDSEFDGSSNSLDDTINEKLTDIGEDMALPMKTLKGTSHKAYRLQVKSRKEQESYDDALDYEAARKDFKKRPVERKEKKRLYDPFKSSDYEAPAAPKKRRLFFSGKSSSYR